VIDVFCFACSEELTEPGGLLFGPPHEEWPSSVAKYHLCRKCYLVTTDLLREYVSEPSDRTTIVSPPALHDRDIVERLDWRVRKSVTPSYYGPGSLWCDLLDARDEIMELRQAVRKEDTDAEEVAGHHQS
jgi:hypothetical protein